LISIVIAAKNAEQTLAKCLNALFEQDYPDFEVIVVNDGSSDKTEAIVGGYPGLKVLRTSGVGRSEARNLGVKEARGSYIAFTDADCMVNPDWLNELLKGFTSNGVAAAGGIQRSPSDETWFGKKVHQFLSSCGFFTNYMQSFRDIREVTHNASCNVIYLKSAYANEGGFSSDFGAGEDPDLDHRLRKRGYRIFFNPKAIVYHYRAKTLRLFWNMMHRYGAAQGKLVMTHGIFRPVQWLPLLSTLIIILLVTGLATHPVLTLIAAFLFAGAILAWLSFDPVLFWLGTVAFVAWHGGFIKGLLMKNCEVP
jgi:GT2 family glycosyltransferase